MVGRRAAWVSIILLMGVSLCLIGSTAEMYFSSDKNGQNRVTNVQEGTSVWIVIHDPDENIDCDVRDKIWTDVKIMDPKTGAYIVWVSLPELYVDIAGHAASAAGAKSGPLSGTLEGTAYKGHYPGNPGSLRGDYLEETGADTGLFVSKRAFTIGTREDFDEPYKNTHVVDTRGVSAVGAVAIQDQDGVTPKPAEPAVLASGFPSFQWGGYGYIDTSYGYSPHAPLNASAKAGFLGASGSVRGWFGGETNGSYFLHFIPGLLFPGVTAESYGFLPSEIDGGVYVGPSGPLPWLIGRFENMDTLIGLYQDQNDDTDVALAMMKIIDTEATITWDQEIYKDANGAATITVVDADENLNCNEVEYVPVFILVNPGSWNPVDGYPWSGDGGQSPTNFCMLKRTGGVDGDTGGVGNSPMRWYNIYNATENAYGENGAKDGRYYIQYATQHDSPWNVVYFDTVGLDGITAVSFYAQETGVNTGVFQLNLNSILDDLGFNSLEVRDVLVAYYLDPNDEDDFKLDAAYIEEKMHSITSFTDANRQDKDVYWLGRDPVYVQVIDANANVDSCCPEQVVVLICDVHEEDDAEWIILDETSSNSPVFFTNVGYELRPVWDAMGVGEGFFAGDAGVQSRQGGSLLGGFQLVLDNWKIEAFNEDDIFAQYNDAYYGAPDVEIQLMNDVSGGLAGLGDSDTSTSFPPLITNGLIANVVEPAVSERSIGGSPGVRVPNDVSFDLMSIGDTQVYNGQTVNMYFLDRQGNRVQGYVNSDCVFIEVVDPDQNEDTLRRERIDAFWDGGQNVPFGPKPLNLFSCEYERSVAHPINPLLGDTNIFNNSPIPYAPIYSCLGEANIYVLNPRNGRWAGLDLFETGIGTGDFMSVICVDLVSVYTCVPTLGAVPGDTILAAYMDPSNHSDSAWISIKVGIGGGGTPPSQQSTTTFTNATGAAVVNYTDADLVYVKVVDPSHSGATTLGGALTINGQTYLLSPLAGASNDTFITAGLDLDLAAGDSITATYKDPTDPTDTSTDTITIIASKLEIDKFYAGPSPAAGPVTFGYEGTGIASVMSVAVYDLAGHVVWANELANVTKIVWDCQSVANGAYIYLVTATDGTETFRGKGTVFIRR
jgi:hypothetical protein